MALFQQQWQLFRKFVENNLLYHREAYGELHRILVEEAVQPFRFLDIACGDASATADAHPATAGTGDDDRSWSGDAYWLIGSYRSLPCVAPTRCRKPILKASIAQLAQAVEEDGTRQGVLRFAFVQPQLYPLVEFRSSGL